MPAPSTDDLQQYHRWVCDGFAAGKAVEVQFRKVSIGDWTPSVAHCHDNVDRWVKHHPSAKAVRGWAWQGGDGLYSTVVAHSVVRDGAELFDITPQCGAEAGKAVRFLEDTSNGAAFAALRVQKRSTLHCPCDLPTEVFDVARLQRPEAGPAGF